MMRRAVERIVATTDRDEQQAEAALRRPDAARPRARAGGGCVAGRVLRLPEAAAINGQTLVLDGGGIQQ